MSIADRRYELNKIIAQAKRDLNNLNKQDKVYLCDISKPVIERFSKHYSMTISLTEPFPPTPSQYQDHVEVAFLENENFVVQIEIGLYNMSLTLSSKNKDMINEIYYTKNHQTESIFKRPQLYKRSVNIKDDLDLVTTQDSILSAHDMLYLRLVSLWSDALASLLRECRDFRDRYYKTSLEYIEREKELSEKMIPILTTLQDSIPVDVPDFKEVKTP